MTRVHVMTLPFDSALGRFDDAGVKEFLADKELIEVRDHFFEHQRLPYLALVLVYRLGQERAPAPRPAAGKRRSEAWRDLLRPEDMPLFNTLREWRSERAKRDGVPPYVICNNRQLAQVLRRRPRNLAQLGEVEGFGKGKLARYGAEILAILHRGAESEPQQERQGTEGGNARDGTKGEEERGG